MRSLILAASLVAACAPKEVRVSYTELTSEAEQKPMRYGVYTPPGWDGVTPLPLVVFLHGGGDDETAWERHPVVTDTLDRWIADGRLPPFVAVIPDGETGFWRNWDDGTHRYADWVMDEVIPSVRSTYPLLPEPEHMHLMGISMGGAGTLFTGLDHLDRFASLNVFSAPIMDVEQSMKFLTSGLFSVFAPMERIFGPADLDKVTKDNAYTRVASDADLRGTRLLVGAGSVDMPGILKSNKGFHDHLASKGVDHTFIVYRGGHRWQDWARMFPVALCRALTPDTCVLPPDPFYTLVEVADGAAPLAEDVAHRDGAASMR